MKEMLSDRVARLERSVTRLDSENRALRSLLSKHSNQPLNLTWAKITGTTATANLFDAVALDIVNAATAASPTDRSASSNIKVATVKDHPKPSVGDFVPVEKEKGIWTALPTGGSGNATNVLSNDFSATHTNLNSGYGFPEATRHGSTDNGIFTNSLGGVTLLKEGTFAFDVPILLRRFLRKKENTIGLITTDNEVYDDSGTDRVRNNTYAEGVGQPQLQIHDVDHVQFDLYVYDSSGSPQSGVKVDTWSFDYDFITHYAGDPPHTPSSAIGIDAQTADPVREEGFCMSEAFSITQAAIDNAIGSVKIYLLPTVNGGLTINGGGEYSAAIRLIHIDELYEDGLTITVV